MSRIRNKNTKPEILVRKFLFSNGFRYRLNVKKLPGTPDIVLKKYRTVIFINGCFWHGHDVDGHIPLSNSEYWRKKINRNQIRDEQNKKKLLDMGWTVITIWECQLKPSTKEKTLNELEYYLNKTYLDRFRIKTYPEQGSESINLVAEEQIKYIKE